MTMRAEPRVLLTIALMLSSGLGCGEGESTDHVDGQVSIPTFDATTGPIMAGGGGDSGVSSPPGQLPSGQVDAGNTPVRDSGGAGGNTDSGPGPSTDAGQTTTDKDATVPPVTGDSGTTGGGGGPVPTVDKVEMKGPFTATHITNGGPKGSSWVFYPMEIGKDGMKHPVFNWGPGAGTGPDRYVDHLNTLASHGIVVISQPSSGSGADEIPALDWIIAQNEKSGSPFFGKLDTKKVGAGGHSLGSLTTMKMAKDPRLTVYVLVCGGSFSGTGGGGAADIHAPAIILGGDSDNPGTPNFEGDYKEIKTPAIFLTKNGTDHIACARNNLMPWTAFLRWNFYGEDKWKPNFLEGGEYCKTPWKCKSKGL
jgi:hypothetical protein